MTQTGAATETQFDPQTGPRRQPAPAGPGAGPAVSRAPRPVDLVPA
jgi:hypothetical protein